MNKEVRNILKEAQQIVEHLEQGKNYPSGYVAQRFQKAADKHTTDQLINHMNDAIQKKASRQEFVSQKEIGELYDHLYGFSGGQTAFRDLLGDMLPANRQFAKVAYQGSKNRTLEEKPAIPVHTNTELSDAFSILFSLGNDSSFSTFKPGQDKTVQKVVVNKLNALGHMPKNVDIVHTNEHFALCVATYDTPSLKKISALIPVQITDGMTKEPTHLISDGQAVDLESRSLYLYLKEQEKLAKSNAQVKFASERGDGSAAIEISKVVVPKSLEEFTNLETSLMAAASKLDINQVNMAMGIVNSDLLSFGARNPEIKVGSSDSTGLIVNASIPTKVGKVAIQIPVEFQNGKPLLPARFATSATGDQKIYDFSKAGFASFMENIHDSSDSLKSVRDTEPLARMSYHQLMDKVIEGVSSKDYRLAEDALMSIQARFDSNVYTKALDQFTEMLKHSSSNSTKRKEFIKAAYDRGDLIKVPTSVELYCPKLALPLSKVDFDEKGRPIPKGRHNKLENQFQDTSISTGRVILT